MPNDSTPGPRDLVARSCVSLGDEMDRALERVGSSLYTLDRELFSLFVKAREAVRWRVDDRERLGELEAANTGLYGGVLPFRLRIARLEGLLIALADEARQRGDEGMAQRIGKAIEVES